MNKSFPKLQWHERPSIDPFREPWQCAASRCLEFYLGRGVEEEEAKKLVTLEIRENYSGLEFHGIKVNHPALQGFPGDLDELHSAFRNYYFQILRPKHVREDKAMYVSRGMKEEDAETLAELYTDKLYGKNDVDEVRLKTLSEMAIKLIPVVR